jgi:leucyl-tRNA synthetase
MDRYKLWRKVKERAHIGEGEPAVGWPLFVKKILFPKEWLRWKLSESSPIKRDFYTGQVKIYGQWYSEEMLRAMGDWPEGVVFLWEKREGSWVIRRLDPYVGEGLHWTP